MRTLSKLPALVAAGLVAAVATADAQEMMEGRYQVSAYAGLANFDEASAIEDDFGGGLDARYYVTDNVGIGFYFSGSRPETDGSFFPLVRLEFADTVLTQLVSQEIGIYEVGVAGTFRLPANELFTFYGTGGVGRYIVTLDAQASNAPTIPGAQEFNFDEWGFMLGGGVDIMFNEDTGIRLGIKDMIYTDFDRDRLNISDPLFQEENLPHPRPNPPEAEDTIHNLRFSVGLNFFPGG